MAVLSPLAVGSIPNKAVPLFLAFAFFFWWALRRRFRGIKPEFLLLLATFCVCVAGADLFMRPLLADKIYPRPEDRFRNRWPPMPEIARFVPNARFEGEVSGDLAGLAGIPAYHEKRRVLFETDKFGFRNFKDAAEQPVDVLLVGDSIGAGMNASQDKIWPEILQKKYGLRVYNVSTGGCPWDFLMNLQVQIDKLLIHPDTVILFVVTAGNDIVGQYYPWLEPHIRNLPERLWIAYGTFRSRSPMRLLLSRALTAWQARRNFPESLKAMPFLNGKPMLFLKDFYAYQRMTPDEVLRHENYPLLEGVFRKLGEFAKTKGVRVGVVVMPPKEDVYSWVFEGKSPWASDRTPTGFTQAVRGLSEKEHFQFLDPKTAFIEASEKAYRERGQSLWWYDDSHWNDEGNAAAAQIVYDGLLEGMLVPKKG